MAASFIQHRIRVGMLTMPYTLECIILRVKPERPPAFSVAIGCDKSSGDGARIGD